MRKVEIDDAEIVIAGCVLKADVVETGNDYFDAHLDGLGHWVKSDSAKCPSVLVLKVDMTRCVRPELRERLRALKLKHDAELMDALKPPVPALA